jgi:hypothetical protein
MLVKYDVPTVLVLLDFSSDPFEEHELEAFRSCPSVRKGNHHKSQFSVAYFYLKSKKPRCLECIRKITRVAWCSAQINPLIQQEPLC